MIRPSIKFEQGLIGIEAWQHADFMGDQASSVPTEGTQE